MAPKKRARQVSPTHSEFSDLGDAPAPGMNQQTPGVDAPADGASANENVEVYTIRDDDVFNEETCQIFEEYALRHQVNVEGQREIAFAMLSFAEYTSVSAVSN
jgi:hypothetical protein